MRQSIMAGWRKGKDGDSAKKARVDPADGAALVGKHLLVGLTYLDHAGQPSSRRQVHGTVLRVNAAEGIVIALEPSGEEFTLPPAFEAIEPAAPGEYRLHSTGEIVVDPDFTATFRVTPPDHH